MTWKSILSNAMATKTKINPLLSGEVALSQAEAALILGCRARDVKNHIQPDFILGRPKYIAKNVIALRNKLIEKTKQINEK